jgi:hypothetical protein
MELPRPQQVSFNQRWELLKAELEKLYLDDKLTVPQIKKLMRDAHDFDAK